ncbi:MAG: hypothetical protein U0V74_17590 [Chitinophagales bacterium]
MMDGTMTYHYPDGATFNYSSPPAIKARQLHSYFHLHQSAALPADVYADLTAGAGTQLGLNS